MIDARINGQEARRVRITDEVHGIPRHGQSALDFGADRDPVDISAERVPQERVELVPAVVADLLAEEAGADAEFYFFMHT